MSDFYRPICHVQREIFYLAQRLPDCREKEQILERIKEAHVMAKKMDTRLKELSPRYNKETWDKPYKGGDMIPLQPKGKV